MSGVCNQGFFLSVAVIAMAFFGITALGPQEMYKAARDDCYDLTLFQMPGESFLFGRDLP